jgi:hypothetical protein
MIESSDKIMRGKNSLLSRDVRNVKFEKEKKKERNILRKSQHKNADQEPHTFVLESVKLQVCVISLTVRRSFKRSTDTVDRLRSLFSTKTDASVSTASTLWPTASAVLHAVKRRTFKDSTFTIEDNGTSAKIRGALVELLLARFSANTPALF